MQVGNKTAAVSERDECCGGEPFDYRHWIAVAIGAERSEVGVKVNQQAGRHRHGDLTGELSMA